MLFSIGYVRGAGNHTGVADSEGDARVSAECAEIGYFVSRLPAALEQKSMGHATHGAPADNVAVRRDAGGPGKCSAGQSNEVNSPLLRRYPWLTLAAST